MNIVISFLNWFMEKIRLVNSQLKKQRPDLKLNSIKIGSGTVCKNNRLKLKTFGLSSLNLALFAWIRFRVK